MISLPAQHALQQMVHRAIQASPLVLEGFMANITDLPDLSRLGTQQVVLLTVSCYEFRLILLIHFSPDAQTYAHFATVNKLAPAEMEEQSFIDAIRECANRCCGNLNRDLARVFTHVGMSTPNIIDRRCVDYLHKLGEGYLQHFALQHPGGPAFGVSICVNAFTPLDFACEVTAAQETGALELF